jgi:phosphoglycolate phosphatase
MTQAIIFDLDGTLVDSCGICIGILEGMNADRGFTNRIDHDHARVFMSRGGETMVAALLGEASRDPADDLLEFRARYAETTTSTDALFEGVAEGLRELHKRGFELAICSNKPQLLCDKVIADTGIAPYFCAVVGGRAELKPKPAPDLLDSTLDLLQRPPHHCVYVGDSELDHLVAASAGMDFYYLTYGYAEPGWEPDGCHVFDHFSLLSNTLAQLRASAGA